MNRLTAGLPLALTFALLSVAALPGAAFAADDAPATTTDTPAATSTTPPATTPPADSSQQPTRAVVTSARNTSDYEVRRMFCLNMSMQCFSIQQELTAHNPNGSLRRLDLHAPDIRRLVSESELQEPILDEYEMLQEQEQVEVEGTRPEVYVPGGLLSLPWAVMHPTQAWRIFLPVQTSK